MGLTGTKGRRGRVFEIKYDASLSQNGERTTGTYFPVGDISVVILIRTDTTIDHSQKAEKV